MIHRLLLFAWALPLVLAPAAQAGPALYATSFVVSVSQSDCLENTREALLKAGMGSDDIAATNAVDAKGKDVQNGWSAEHPTENVSLLFECDARNGMGALAVAGANNDITYKIYEQIWEIWMK